ncbi:MULTISPECIES: hypothetical protein [unclassified Arcicella]|uniref:hypothetical protein n=1 Tax=unclassified Arcicella TaxID=2644986 RepID=UPI00286051B8|nr:MULTISPECIES: hypothetical protein [unclassified Arcicella]MDR6564387.1 hypothetical protein [Arcicella sp. BE51]MDR6814136.1 hypothetical protein [Arcicella sp. BE140]MDR6825448.1 hypothetical protein [Arcicella sp. BE139]
MKIIAHHTCSSDGDINLIELNGPFLSTHVENEPNQYKFLGTGYYFWDNNLGMAHSHGQNNYKRRYYIFEAALTLDEDILYDLAGNRIDMINFQEIINKLQAFEETKNWGIAHYIEFLKRQGMFPYRAIRAIDTSINPKEIFNFVPDRKNFTNLNPIFIVCLLDKENDLIKSFKHIKTFPNNG